MLSLLFLFGFQLLCHATVCISDWQFLVVAFLINYSSLNFLCLLLFL